MFTRLIEWWDRALERWMGLGICKYHKQCLNYNEKSTVCNGRDGVPSDNYGYRCYKTPSGEKPFA
jgi:hypothetical protein